MKDFIKVMGSLIDRILGYMLAIMFAISFFINYIKWSDIDWIYSYFNIC